MWGVGGGGVCLGMHSKRTGPRDLYISARSCFRFGGSRGNVTRQKLDSADRSRSE